MTDDLPTDRYFPAKHPRHTEARDVAARALAIVAILLAVGLHVADYIHRLNEVEDNRAVCVREERDLRVELRAWQSVYLALGLEDADAQINRVEAILRRDCDERYPDPGIL